MMNFFHFMVIKVIAKHPNDWYIIQMTINTTNSIMSKLLHRACSLKLDYDIMILSFLGFCLQEINFEHFMIIST